MPADPRAREVLAWWFGDPIPTATPIDPEISRKWFLQSDETDNYIRNRFGAFVDEALAGTLTAWNDSPRGRLAHIILLDQFTRNIFRNTPRAFAGDEAALHLTMDGVNNGVHKNLGFYERTFLYLPLEHSEDLQDQELSVTLFQELAHEVPPGLTAIFEDFLDYAVRHHRVVERFGRFPHRNAILGRESTTEEIEFLADGEPF